MAMRTTTIELLQARLAAYLDKQVQAEGADIAKALRIKRADVPLAAAGLIRQGHIVTARVIRDGKDADILYRASGRVPKGSPGRKAA